MRDGESKRRISKRAALGIHVVELFVAAVGCSTANPSDLSDPSAFCVAYSKATANHQLACLGGSLTVVMQPSCVFGTNTEVSSGRLSYDPVAASSCLDELPVLPCWHFDGPDCSKVFTGTIPEGGACFPAFGLTECVPGTRCVADVQCPGVCTGYAQLGEACVADDESSLFCGAGLSCAPGSNPQCVAIPVPTPGVGTPCGSDYDCLSGDVQLACEGPNGPINGTSSGTAQGSCQAPRDDGPCFSPSDCRSDVCAGGVCLPPKVTGDACTPGLGECGPGTYCGTTGACVLLPTVGQSCAASAGEGKGCLDVPCDPVSLICLPLGNLGDSCQQTGICSIELTCDSKTLTCVPSCIRGNACGAPGQVCCDGTGPTGLCNSGSACVNAICAS